MMKTVIFTGAGVSVASGLGTFRGDAKALWENFDPNVVCNMDTFHQNRKKVFEFYNMRKSNYRDAKPNVSHTILTELQRITKATLYTSNVDLLHEAAGAKDVRHLHGSMDRMMCVDCDHNWDIGRELFDVNGLCPKCGSKWTKPGIIFFGEHAPMYEEFHAATEGTLKLVFGTSLNVISPWALGCHSGGLSVFFDPEPGDADRHFDLIVKKKSEDLTLTDILHAIQVVGEDHGLATLHHYNTL